MVKKKTTSTCQKCGKVASTDACVIRLLVKKEGSASEDIVTLFTDHIKKLTLAYDHELNV